MAVDGRAAVEAVAAVDKVEADTVVGLADGLEVDVEDDRALGGPQARSRHHHGG